jgi:hypothetical protein
MVTQRRKDATIDFQQFSLCAFAALRDLLSF